MNAKIIFILCVFSFSLSGCIKNTSINKNEPSLYNEEVLADMADEVSGVAAASSTLEDIQTFILDIGNDAPVLVLDC